MLLDLFFLIRKSKDWNNLQRVLLLLGRNGRWSTSQFDSRQISVGHFTLQLDKSVWVDGIGNALTESCQQLTDVSDYRSWALLACSSLEPGGQPLDLMGPLCKLTHWGHHVESSIEWPHSMWESTCLSDNSKQSFSQFFAIAGDFYVGMSQRKWYVEMYDVM